jgi:hypothetical protein
MYSVLKIQEPIGPASILTSPPSATVMVCTMGDRLSLIEFRRSPRPGAALLV